MICPICHQAMRQDRDDVRTDGSTKKQYNRNVYQCMGDDVWMTLEIPVDHSSQVDYENDEVVVD